ncbi:pentapeptide repeat-containing protein [Roseibium litorale]|uniref:Pentapeptide repeat-containing protein n=1 Tax=Roseibium litorale TaxID=2803841 RepID=A0ABR9CTB7_9HYPH|nr:pentapeptide repeat-containing protein [Roseibium litorale]MBD8894120.1 pentapeptide repeat-containing protein [Roseibium litorale]
MTRKVFILSCLFFVGVVSFAFSIYTDPNISLQQALLSLGTEGLKTAVLFVLVDYLIGDHEKRKESIRQAQVDLNLAAGHLKSGVNEHLDRLEVDGKISIELTSDHKLSGQDFTSRIFEESKWDSADLSRAQFTNCELNRVEIVGVSLKGAIFEDVKFDGVIMRAVDLSRCLFVRCDFQSSNIAQAHCSETRFSDCHFFAMNKNKFPKSGADYLGCVGVPADVR